MKTKMIELANNLRSSRDAWRTTAKDRALEALDGDQMSREFAILAKARADSYDHAQRCVTDLIREL